MVLVLQQIGRRTHNQTNFFPHGHRLLQDIIRCKASQNITRCKTLLVGACTGSCGEGLSAEATRGPLAEGDRRFSAIFYGRSLGRHVLQNELRAWLGRRLANHQSEK